MALIQTNPRRRRYGVAAIAGVLGKDIHSVCIIGTLITDFLYHCHRLLVVDDVTNLTDELLWILLKLKEGGVLTPD